ncbi:MAG: LptF/LptG family permease [Akkermansiaceae bacterium]
MLWRVPVNTLKAFLWPVLLTVLGAIAAVWVEPREAMIVEEHIKGFPDTDAWGHRLRPALLMVLCLLPALAAWLYRFSGLMDRYMTKQFLKAFGLCMGALIAVMMLADLSNRFTDFQQAPKPFAAAMSYYSIYIPAQVVDVLPYVLMLSLLFCLGKMSRHQEVVAMIQTGRSVLRVVRPLLVTGLFCTIVCLIFNYHWGPWAQGHKRLVVDLASKGEADRATAVQYRDKESRRVWFVGAFPYQFEKTGVLRNVKVMSFDENGHPISRLQAKSATWSHQERTWRFDSAQVLDLRASPVPLKVKGSSSVERDWKETPHQLVKPGLDHTHLGIPELNSWLKAHEGVEWANKLPYLTQWHYRFAQPWICMVVIILAAPLGIVFSRRGIGGGVSVAFLLCTGILFTSPVFLTVGEAGHLPAALAAWGTNILFSLIAIYLFSRRVAGRPIYDSLKKLLPSGE